jgi:hypothetical protein
MPLPYAAVQSILEAYLPNTGLVGYIALLNATVYTGTATLVFGTGVWTSASAHGFVTGTRVRLTNSGGSLPGVSGTALSSSTDYFVFNASGSTFSLATSLATAQAASGITYLNAGTGTQTVTEQALNASTQNPDPLNVTLSKELPVGGGYNNRITITGIGASSIVSNRAEKQVTFTLTGDSTGYTYRYYQLIVGAGASATIGNTGGTQSYLTAESSNVTVNSSTPKFTFLRFALSSP